MDLGAKRIAVSIPRWSPTINVRVVIDRQITLKFKPAHEAVVFYHVMPKRVALVIYSLHISYIEVHINVLQWQYSRNHFVFTLFPVYL